MTTLTEVKPSSECELALTRLIDAPRAALCRHAWTEPELLKQWFAPLPYTTPRAELDVRPGGSSLVVMQGPDGVQMPNYGVYLEVVPNEKIVFTDSFLSAWVPNPKPFMTVTLTFEAEAGRTRYTARVVHPTIADRERHEQMGFHRTSLGRWGQPEEMRRPVLFLAVLAKSLVTTAALVVPREHVGHF